MKTYPVKNDSFEAINKKGEHKPFTDFSATLKQATSAVEHHLQPLHPVLKPLSQEDFAGGDSALPAENGKHFKALDLQRYGSAAQVKLRPLNALDHVPGAKAANDDPDTYIRTQVKKLVGQTFYANILKQMHDDPFKSNMFDGGRGGEAFAPMFDQQIADHIAQSSSNKLVESMVDHIESTLKKRGQLTGTNDKPAAVMPANNPYWNERTNVAPGIRA
jgi:Rod binding domain-containing protein